MNKENREYLIERLRRIIDLIDSDQKHMAIAKLLADISALKGYDEWELIKTAPKNGAWILALNAKTNHKKLHVVHYSDRHSKRFPWVTDSDPMGFVDGLTHWMPLPEPPNTEEE